MQSAHRTFRGPRGPFGRAVCVAFGPSVLLSLAGCGALLGIDEVDLLQGAEPPGGSAGRGSAGSSGPGPAGAMGAENRQGGGGRAGAAAGQGGAGSPPLGGTAGVGQAGGGAENGAGGRGVGGAGGGCPQDAFEPNQGIDEAKKLDSLKASCEPPKALNGVLSGNGDDDWFSARGETVALTCPNAAPKASVGEFVAARVCYYVQPSPSVEIGCSVGSAVTDVGGYKGCCGDGAVALTYPSGGLVDPPANILLRVSPLASADACVPYTLVYDF